VKIKATRGFIRSYIYTRLLFQVIQMAWKGCEAVGQCGYAAGGAAMDEMPIGGSLDEERHRGGVAGQDYWVWCRPRLLMLLKAPHRKAGAAHTGKQGEGASPQEQRDFP